MAASTMAGDILPGLSDCWSRDMLSLCLLLLAFFASGKYAKNAIWKQEDYILDLLNSFNDAIEDGLRGYVMQSYHGLYSSSNFFISDISAPTRDTCIVDRPYSDKQRNTPDLRQGCRGNYRYTEGTTRENLIRTTYDETEGVEEYRR